MSHASTRLVMLPGLDGTGILFRPFLKALPASSTATLVPKVISYPADEELGYEALLPIVMAALPTDEPFVLLGESFGGPLALHIAARRPRGLIAVVLCASFVTCPYDVPKWTASLVNALPFHFFSGLSHVRAVLGGYARPELDALLDEAMSEARPHVMAYRARQIVALDASDALLACNVPLLYLRGEYDTVVPARNAQRIAELKPTVVIADIPAPHLLLQTQPALAWAAIDTFMTALTAATP